GDCSSERATDVAVEGGREFDSVAPRSPSRYSKPYRSCVAQRHAGARAARLLTEELDRAQRIHSGESRPQLEAVGDAARSLNQRARSPAFHDGDPVRANEGQGVPRPTDARHG